MKMEKETQVNILEDVESPESIYLKGLIPLEREPALSLRKYGEANNVPIIPTDTASMLRTLIEMNRPTRILEIGTAIGYSATVMLEYPWVKEVVTLEKNEEMAEKAKEHFRLNGLEDRVKILVGDAMETIALVEGVFDLIFIDAAKGHYYDFLKRSSEHLRIGGLFVCDNVLFRGMLADRSKFKRRKVTIVKRLKKFLNFISDCPSLQTSVLNVGDGLSISVKLEEILFPEEVTPTESAENEE